MKMALLQQREAFPDILQATLQPHFSRLAGHPVKVTWHASRPHRRPGSQIWLSNSRVNAIFLPGGDPARFRPLVLEFGRHPRGGLRSLAQRLYVRLAFSSMAGALADGYLAVEPGLPMGLDLLVVPGNHKVRVLDVRRRRVTSLLKPGAPMPFLEAEREGRRLAQSHGLPMPPVEAWDLAEGWLEEPWVDGVPLDRHPDPGAAHQAFQKLGQGLFALAKATQNSESPEQARVRLCGETRPEEKYSKAYDLIRSCLEHAQRLQPGPSRISFTHGDFQPGNAWLTPAGPMLIDWEYSGWRVPSFDALVWHLRSRFPKGLADRWNTFVEEGLPQDLPWATDLADPLLRQAEGFRFLAEELRLKWDEASSPLIQDPGPGWEQLLGEVRQCLDSRSTL